MEGLKHYLFNADKRDDVINRLTQTEFDLVIVGGGITGAGILLDAASRGLTVALIEKNDFAFGTSSKSTKLIHGGLRYLKNFEFGLVKKVGRERAIAYQNAPHLVVPEKMLLPLVKGGSFGKFATNIGLWLYDKLAGVLKEDRRKMLSFDEVTREEPLLNNTNLLGAGFYAEYRTDDSRLTLEIIKTALKHKGLPISYMEVDELTYKNKQVCGVRCTDHISNRTIEVKAKKVINASGPWSDQLRKKDNSLNNKRLQLTKGVHIVLKHSLLPIKHSTYFDVGDGRMIFAIPRFNSTYIGTTDTIYSDNIDAPDTNEKDAQYLLDATNRMFQTSLKLSQIDSSWSGLRPLIHEEGKSPSELSRKDEVFISQSGLITIAGGKLTGYRLMAKKVTDLVCKELTLKHPCKTGSIQINGGEFDTPNLVEGYILSVKSRLKSLGLDESKANYLVRTYGKQTNYILEVYTNKHFSSIVEAEVWYSLRYECVYSLLDFFLRRTGKINFEMTAVPKEVQLVLPLFCDYLKWPEEKKNIEINALNSYCQSVSQFK